MVGLAARSRQNELRGLAALLALLLQGSVASAQASGTTWSTLVLIYEHVDADYSVEVPGGGTVVRHAKGDLTAAEIQAGAAAAQNDFPRRVSDWSGGLGAVRVFVLPVARPITHVTPACGGFYVDPVDAKPELDQVLPMGRWDSIFAIWSTRNDADGVAMPAANCSGLASFGVNGVTYPFTWQTVLGNQDLTFGGTQHPGEVFAWSLLPGHGYDKFRVSFCDAQASGVCDASQHGDLQSRAGHPALRREQRRPLRRERHHRGQPRDLRAKSSTCARQPVAGLQPGPEERPAGAQDWIRTSTPR